MSLGTLKMPRLGETMEQGEITTWLVEVGQSFARGEAILEVETDKTVVEYPALGAGVLAEILADEGDMVTVGDPIARIDLRDAPDWTVEDRDEEDAEPARETSPGIDAQFPPTISRVEGKRTRATPVARKLTRDAGLDIGTITGTGRRGRVEASDVMAAQSDQQDVGVRISHGIAYVKTGPANGATFLFLHGFAGDHTGFSALESGLKRAGHLAVTLDLPGHGETEIDARNADELFTNLTDFTRSQMGDTPFHLVAHSLGAIPALALAQTVELASLTLIAPVGIGAAINKEFLAGMASPTSAGSVADLLAQLTEKPNGLSKTAIETIFAELGRGRLIQLADSLNSQPVDLMPALKKIAQETPTRILIGQNDRILGSVDSYDLPPEIAVHSFRQTGHMPHWEQMRAVSNILLMLGR